MAATTSSSAGRLIDLGPLVLRVVLGALMFAHGYQKLTSGPEGFSHLLAELGVPAPAFMGYLVTYTELVAGALLVVGLLSRLAALALTIELVVAIVLVKANIGLIAGHGSGAGAELDLAYLAGFLAILLAGPGRVSLDRLVGIERPSRGPMGTVSSTAW
ncbi:MAG: DoxX family protein [Solirubrobacteraceae bacterium]